MVILTIEQLQEAAVWWTRQLCIDDWDIRIELTCAADIDDSWANSRTNQPLAAVLIKVARPDTRKESLWEEVDMEMDLVHEFLHVRLDLATRHCDTHGMDSAAYDVAFERPINALTKTLVRLRRATGKPMFSWEEKG
jgi:hypothetical protein